MEDKDLPRFIRESAILSATDKALLAEAVSLPEEEAVDQIRNLPEIRELLQSFIGDESTRNTHLQLKAIEYLSNNDIDMAWRILLL